MIHMTEQVTLQIEAKLRAAAERAAAAENCSLAELIKRLLVEHYKMHSSTLLPSAPRTNAAPKAAEMAANAIDHLRDKTLPPQEQRRRKDNLIRGPSEFRDMRRK